MTAVTTIRADVLKGLLLIAAKEDLRFYLCGIYFDTENGALVATDGHKLMAYKCDLPKDVKPFILPRATCLQAIKMATKRNNHLDVEIAGEGKQRTVTLRAVGGASCMGLECDGTYPHWRRVIPTRCSLQVGQYDAEYLEQLHAAFMLVLDTTKKCLPGIIHNGETGPALVLNGNENVIGIIMPVRTGNQTDFDGWRKAAFKSFGIDDTPVQDEPALAA